MAAKRIDPKIEAAIVDNWRIGKMSQRQLSKEYGVSLGKVSKLCKDVEQDCVNIVNAGVAYVTELSEHDEHLVNTIEQAVHDKTKHIQFFTNATVRNISSMVGKLNKKTSIYEHKMAQSAIKDGKETVLGKDPTTAIQVNNNPGDDVSAGTIVFQGVSAGDDKQ